MKTYFLLILFVATIYTTKSQITVMEKNFTVFENPFGIHIERRTATGDILIITQLLNNEGVKAIKDYNLQYDKVQSLEKAEDVTKENTEVNEELETEKNILKQKENEFLKFSKSFSMYIYDGNFFKANFARSINELYSAIEINDITEPLFIKRVDEIANEIFYSALLSKAFAEVSTTPPSGNFEIKRYIDVWYGTNIRKLTQQKRRELLIIGLSQLNKPIDELIGNTKELADPIPTAVDASSQVENPVENSENNSAKKEPIATKTCRLNIFKKWCSSIKPENIPAHLKENYIVENVQLEIESGSIKNIIVSGHFTSYPKIDVIFTNDDKPIQLSSITDLSDKETSVVFLRNYGFSEMSDGEKRSGMFFPVNELLIYKPLLSSSAEDYSPADSVYHIDFSKTVPLGDAQVQFLAYKEKTANILYLKVYSDLIGLNSSAPNGIIQTEVEKKFILVPKGSRLINGCNYITPYVSISKIEQDERTLSLINSNTHDSVYQALDFVRFAKYSGGGYLNAASLSLPKIKSTFSFDLAYSIFVTNVADTIKSEQIDTNGIKSSTTMVNNSLIPSHALGFGLIWRIRPDSRYGISLSAKLQHFTVLQDDIEYFIPKKYFQYSTFMFYGFFKPTDKDQFFFRSFFNSYLQNANQNYLQAQIGYTRDINTYRNK